jgi:riboflavin biosynthesis pyrimidine reductase
VSESFLRQILPIEVDLPETEDEQELRRLYAHLPGVTRLGMSTSVNGKSAGPDGSSRSLGGPADGRIIRVLRSLADVVLVGAHTARTELYGDLTVRESLRQARLEAGLASEPVLAIVTRSGILPPHLCAERTIVVTTADAPAASASAPWATRTVIAGSTSLVPGAILEALHARGLERVLCEGGPRFAQTLLAATVIDDYCLTSSPHQGGEHAPAAVDVPRDLRLAHRLVTTNANGGDFTMDRWVAAALSTV